ncbi:Small nuclear RNA activating complex [Mactra antiquata]
MSKLPLVRSIRRRKHKYDYQPCVGVKTDFEALLQRFSAFGTVRYETFAECWREMKMSSYCAGRQTQREAREFVEDCFLIASQYWLPPSSFLIRAGALYLLYGLYYYQLVLPKVKIRVTHPQWLKVLEFQQEAKEQRHHDLDFIFHKMLLEKVFLFVATEDDMYPRQKGLIETKVIPDDMKDETGLLDEIFSQSSVNQLSFVHSQYQKMKTALNKSGSGQPDTSLNIVHSDLIDNINKTLDTYRGRQRMLARRVYQNPIPGTSTDDYDVDNDELTYEMNAESVSTKKHLKLKAFEMGACETRKRQKAEKDGDKSWHIDVSQKVTQLQTGSRRLGRKNIVDLYNKDEHEDAPIESPKVQGLFCMPDIDAALSSQIKPLGSTSEDTGDNTDTTVHKTDDDDDVIKSPVTAKGKRKTAPKKADKNTQPRSKRKAANNSLDNVDSASPSKKLTVSARRDSKSSKRKSLPQSDDNNSSSSKIGKASKNIVDNSEDKEPDNLTEDVNELSAQEKLQIKLTQRRKEARLKKNSTSVKRGNKTKK